jgi:hypothetical protein
MPFIIGVKLLPAAAAGSPVFDLDSLIILIGVLTDVNRRLGYS